MKWMENSVILLIEKMPPIDGWPTQIVMLRKSRSTFAGRGGYFCVLLLSLPKEYPIPKQVKPKLTTAIKSTILIGLALLSSDSLSGFYVIGGSQSLRRGPTAYRYGGIWKYSNIKGSSWVIVGEKHPQPQCLC